MIDIYILDKLDSIEAEASGAVLHKRESMSLPA